MPPSPCFDLVLPRVKTAAKELFRTSTNFDNHVDFKITITRRTYYVSLHFISFQKKSSNSTHRLRPKLPKYIRIISINESSTYMMSRDHSPRILNTIFCLKPPGTSIHSDDGPSAGWFWSSSASPGAFCYAPGQGGTSETSKSFDKKKGWFLIYHKAPHLHCFLSLSQINIILNSGRKLEG